MPYFSTPFEQPSNSPSVFGQASPAMTSAFNRSSTSPAISVFSGFGHNANSNDASISPLFGGFGQSSSFGHAGSSVLFGTSSSFGGSAPSFGNRSLSFGAFGQPYARPSVSFGTTTGVFGGSEPSFGRPLFANTSSSFGVNESKRNTFEYTSFEGFCNQDKGSRVSAYRVTISEDDYIMQSVSAMPDYRGKSHEELRLEDYNAGDKGSVLQYPLLSRERSSGLYTSQNPSTQTTYNVFPPQPTSNSTFSQNSSMFPQISNNPFPPPIHLMHSTANLSSGFFPPQTTSTLSAQPFPDKNVSGFFPPQTSLSSLSGTCPLATSPFTFTPTNPIAFQPSPSSYAPQPTTDTDSVTRLLSTFPPVYSTASQTSPFLFAPQPKTDSDSAFGPSFTFRPTNLFACHTSPSPFSPQPTTKGASEYVPSTISSVNPFSYPSFVAPSPTISTSNANTGAQIPFLSNASPSAHAVQNTNTPSSAEVAGPSFSNQGRSSTVDQPVVNAIPFEELPAISRLSISLPGSTISVEYEISRMPVRDNPLAPDRFSSSSTSSQVSHYHIRLPAQKPDKKSEEPKVESAREGVTSENNTKPSNVFHIDLSDYEPDEAHHVQLSQEEDEIKELIPQLSLVGYYTEPSITQLTEMEKAEPGYCGRVNDFEIGRCGFGSIKFLGETDVRNLSLDSLVELCNRKVVVYKNENEKPRVGEGINKQAEITLLNIDCVDKRTGKRHVDGPKVEKYKEKLIKKGEEQGAEFVSYDPAKGEWKFKVQHF